jgi:hypothetical protein
MSSKATPTGNREPRIKHQKSRGWIWFFVILGTLTAAAAAIEIWYNLRQQLTPERLAAARQLWREKGPARYQVEYLLKREDGSEQRFRTRVEDGAVVSVTRSDDRPLQEGRYPFAGMDGLFDYMEKRLQTDSEAGGPWVFATAVFDRNDGHVLRYVRSVRSPRERLEVIVNLRP